MIMKENRQFVSNLLGTSNNYAVYVEHDVFAPWMEWYDSLEEASEVTANWNKTPEHTATLLKVLGNES